MGVAAFKRGIFFPINAAALNKEALINEYRVLCGFIYGGVNMGVASI